MTTLFDFGTIKKALPKIARVADNATTAEREAVSQAYNHNAELAIEALVEAGINAKVPFSNEQMVLIAQWNCTFVRGLYVSLASPNAWSKYLPAEYYTGITESAENTAIRGIMKARGLSEEKARAVYALVMSTIDSPVNVPTKGKGKRK